MRGLLEAHDVRTFGDLVRREDVELKYRYKLQVIASDVTERRLLVLPRDAPSLGITRPDDLDVARAVRMSIPIFFEPVSLTNRRTNREHLIVDGGDALQLPDLALRRRGAPVPTIGLKLTRRQSKPIGEELAEPVPRGGVTQVIGYLRSLVDTMMAAHDRLYVEQHDFDQRTIGIDPLGVGTTEFALSPKRALDLFDSGRAAAGKFLDGAPDGARDTGAVASG